MTSGCRSGRSLDVKTTRPGSFVSQGVLSRYAATVDISAIQWGNAAEWVASLAAGMAAFYSLRLFRREAEARRAAERESVRQAEDQRRSLAIGVWLDHPRFSESTGVDGTSLLVFFTAMLRNLGPQPIRDVVGEMTASSHASQLIDQPTARVVLSRFLEPGGQESVKVCWKVAAAGITGLNVANAVKVWSAYVEFTDAAGHRWRMDDAHTLSDLASSE